MTETSKKCCHHDAGLLMNGGHKILPLPYDFIVMGLPLAFLPKYLMFLSSRTTVAGLRWSGPQKAVMLTRCNIFWAKEEIHPYEIRSSFSLWFLVLPVYEWPVCLCSFFFSGWLHCGLFELNWIESRFVFVYKIVTVMTPKCWCAIKDFSKTSLVWT